MCVGIYTHICMCTNIKAIFDGWYVVVDGTFTGLVCSDQYMPSLVGVEPGTVMVAGFLSHTDLLLSYRATSPYISNPYATMTQTSPEIARR